MIKSLCIFKYPFKNWIGTHAGVYQINKASIYDIINTLLLDTVFQISFQIGQTTKDLLVMVLILAETIYESKAVVWPNYCHMAF